MGFPTVLLGDDNPEVRHAITELLESQFQIIGSAADGQQAVDYTLRLSPDVVLLDISMPILNGFEVASRLQYSRCQAKLIFVTVHEGDEYVDAALSTGAQGYVLKQCISTDLIPAIEAVLHGQQFVSQLRKYSSAVAVSDPTPKTGPSRM
jgi:DNA-binding NarL/FixJ family response regulator